MYMQIHGTYKYSDKPKNVVQVSRKFMYDYG